MAKKEEQYFSRADLVARAFAPAYSDDSVFNGHPQSRGVYDAEDVSVLYPIDPRSGYPSSDLGKVMDPLLTDSERQRVLARLSKVEGAYMPSELSDSDIFALIPPRYIAQDAVDVQAWRDYLGKEVFSKLNIDVEDLPIEVNPEASGVQIEDEE